MLELFGMSFVHWDIIGAARALLNPYGFLVTPNGSSG